MAPFETEFVSRDRYRNLLFFDSHDITPYAKQQTGVIVELGGPINLQLSDHPDFNEILGNRQTTAAGRQVLDLAGTFDRKGAWCPSLAESTIGSQPQGESNRKAPVF